LDEYRSIWRRSGTAFSEVTSFPITTLWAHASRMAWPGSGRMVWKPITPAAEGTRKVNWAAGTA